MGATRLARGLLLGALLVLSGAAALAHEAAWQRLWTPVVGAGTRTTAAIVAGMLLGLAAGSAIGGPLADRARRPGLVFAAAEAVGAALGALVPWAVGVADASFGGSSDALRLAVAGFVCAVAAAPLGASLPAAVRVVDPEGARTGAVLSRLYAANTLGAVVGVAWPTAFGFEDWGTRAVVFGAAALQALVAVIALVASAVAVALSARLARESRAESPSAADDGLLRPITRRISLAAFVVGAAGLIVEIAWIRRLTPALGTTSYAFGTVLAAYLVAIAFGAAILGPRSRRYVDARPAWMLALAAVPVVVLIPLVLLVSRAAGSALAAAVERYAADAATLLRIRALAAAALLVPVAAIGAAGLPWIVHAATAPRSDAVGGMVVGGAGGAATTSGRLLAWNTLGSALAALLTGLVVVPAIGTAGALRAAAALYVGAAALLAPLRARRAIAVVAAVVGMSAVVPLPDDAGRDAVGATFDPSWTDPGAAPASFFAEGAVSTVVVRERAGHAELWVDGKVVASGSATDRLHLSLLGHLPMLVHPAPRRAAVIGLGTGITSTAVAAHRPDVLDVFELEPEVERAAEAFRSVGGGRPASARLQFVDGRHGLLRSAERYDVITSDPIHPAVAGSAELYTDEHYAVLDARLAPGGVICQWLPLYEVSADDIACVLRTLSRRFDVAVFVAGPDLVMLAVRPGGFAIDAAAVDRRIVGPVRDSLEPLGLASAGRLLGLLVTGPFGVRHLGGDGPLNTDDRPVLEFSSARSQYLSSSVENLTWLERQHVDPASLLADGPPDLARWIDDVDRMKRSRAALRTWMAGAPEGTDAAQPLFAALADEEPADEFSAWMRDECELASAAARERRARRRGDEAGVAPPSAPAVR